MEEGGWTTGLGELFAGRAPVEQVSLRAKAPLDRYGTRTLRILTPEGGPRTGYRADRYSRVTLMVPAIPPGSVETNVALKIPVVWA